MHLLVLYKWHKVWRILKLTQQQNRKDVRHQVLITIAPQTTMKGGPDCQVGVGEGYSNMDESHKS